MRAAQHLRCTRRNASATGRQESGGRRTLAALSLQLFAVPAVARVDALAAGRAGVHAQPRPLTDDADPKRRDGFVAGRADRRSSHQAQATTTLIGIRGFVSGPRPLSEKPSGRRPDVFASAPCAAVMAVAWAHGESSAMGGRETQIPGLRRRRSPSPRMGQAAPLLPVPSTVGTTRALSGSVVEAHRNVSW